MEALERRWQVAEEAVRDRDRRIADLSSELDERVVLVAANVTDPEEIAALEARAERAEAALALGIADLAQLAEAHATETASLERQLLERAKIIGALEKELLRREHMVRELVASLEEVSESAAVLGPAPAAAARPDAAGDASQRRSAELEQENVRLRAKLDDLAMEVARREGELKARGWRILELENASSGPGDEQDRAQLAELERRLASSRDEIDALRQALRQEHALVEQLQRGENGARSELGRGG